MVLYPDMKTRISFILIAIFILLGLAKLYERTRDFRIDYISAPITYHPQWEIKGLPESKEIRKLLNQPFTYLGKGGQAFAFGSKDGSYVLKFVKFSFLKPRLKHRFISLLPFFEDWQANEMERRLRKFHDLYLGYKYAFEVNPANSGVIYLHINPTFNQFGTVTLFDRKGIKHVVDLDQTVFILQRKSEMLDELLARLLDEGNLDEAKNKIEKILEMYVSHYHMGLHDLGYGVIHNTGFAGDTPIHVDLGKMAWDEEIKNRDRYKPDLIIIAGKIEEWVEKNYPLYHAELSAAITQKLSAVFQEPFSFAAQFPCQLSL